MSGSVVHSSPDISLCVGIVQISKRLTGTEIQSLTLFLSLKCSLLNDWLLNLFTVSINLNTPNVWLNWPCNQTVIRCFLIRHLCTLECPFFFFLLLFFLLNDPSSILKFDDLTVLLTYICISVCVYTFSGGVWLHCSPDALASYKNHQAAVPKLSSLQCHAL